MTLDSSLDPVAAERLSHARSLFTSDLSINEYALPHGAGLEPVDLVMGVSIWADGTAIRDHGDPAATVTPTYTLPMA
jgi:hypothetical protein